MVSVTHPEGSKCIFTGGAHYIILTGYDNGILTINDSNKSNTGKTGRVSLTTIKMGVLLMQVRSQSIDKI